MPALVINLLILMIVVAIVYAIWSILPLPQPLKNIFGAILLVILLVWVLYDLPGFVSRPMYGH